MQVFCRQHSEIAELYDKENGGQSSARNVGLDIAKGDYIAFVDADDYVEPNYLSTLYELIVKNDCGISMCSTNQCLGDDGKGKVFVSQRDFVSEDVKRVISNSSFSVSNKVYRHSLWKNTIFPEGITYEDMAIVPQVMYRCKRFASTSETLYHYRRTPGSTIQSKVAQRKANRDILKAMHILEDSELKKEADLLESIYLKLVLMSFCRTLMLFEPSAKEEARMVLTETFEKYPQIRQNPAIANMPLYPDKAFLRAFLNGHLDMSSYILQSDEKLRNLVKRIIRCVKK